MSSKRPPATTAGSPSSPPEHQKTTTTQNTNNSPTLSFLSLSLSFFTDSLFFHPFSFIFVFALILFPSLLSSHTFCGTKSFYSLQFSSHCALCVFSSFALSPSLTFYCLSLTVLLFPHRHLALLTNTHTQQLHFIFLTPTQGTPLLVLVTNHTQRETPPINTAFEHSFEHRESAGYIERGR